MASHSTTRRRVFANGYVDSYLRSNWSVSWDGVPRTALVITLISQALSLVLFYFRQGTLVPGSVGGGADHRMGVTRTLRTCNRDYGIQTMVSFDHGSC